jgi:hypothetical protein
LYEWQQRIQKKKGVMTGEILKQKVWGKEATYDR